MTAGRQMTVELVLPRLRQGAFERLGHQIRRFFAFHVAYIAPARAPRV